jgi:pyruvate dehydrogenase E1 component
LRRHFHIDPESIAVAVLIELVHRGDVDAGVPAKAVEQYRLRDELLPPEKDTTEGDGG